MKTLREVLAGGIEYSNSWAVYAEKIDGEFRRESPARIGQRQFENGGVLDDCEYFADGETINDKYASYTEDDPLEFYNEFIEEFIDWLIDSVNETQKQ